MEGCTCASLQFRATMPGLARRASYMFRCSATMRAFAWSRARNAALVQVCGSERRCLDFLRRASCVFRCSATMPAFAWSHARNAALVQVCGSERRCLDLQGMPCACSDAVRRCLHLHGAVQGTLHLCKSAVQSDDAWTCKACLVHVPMQCDDTCICMEPCKERCTCASLRFRATMLGLARRASCIFRCSAKMPAFAWSRARNAALVQVCGPERRRSD